jgi:hypothetical protein
MIVTSDEGGRVIITYPKKVREDLMASGIEGSSDIKSSFKFSFIEYDFGKCFLDNNGGITEEEVILSVQNLSNTTATIRCLLKRHPCFRVETPDAVNINNGNEVVALKSPGEAGSKAALQFNPHNVVQFRIVFHPIEMTLIHLPIQFLINETDLVTIQVRGSGCKSKIHVTSNAKLCEMGTIGIGQYGVERFSIENKEGRPILVNCLSECEDKKPDGKNGTITIKHNMVEKHVTLIPRCFMIPPHESVEVLLKFTPPCKMDVFRLPVRAIFGGGEGTLAEIRVRAANAAGSVSRDTMVSPPQKVTAPRTSLELVPLGNRNKEVESYSDNTWSYMDQFSETKATQFLYRGLRTLSPSETPCPSNILVSLLKDVGWRMAVEGQLACLMNCESGLFIEIPNCNSAYSSDDGDPFSASALSNVREVQVDFMCDEICSYELWHGVNIIKSGMGYQDILNEIIIKASDLHNGGTPSVGVQMLELFVYSRGVDDKVTKTKRAAVTSKSQYSNRRTQDDGRELLHITYIKVWKYMVHIFQHPRL